MEDELAQVILSIQIHYSPEKIILFGSYAEGNATEGSDIDLIVIKDTDEDPWSRSEEVERYVRHSVPIDVLVYTPQEIEQRLRMNDFFVRDFIEKGKVLYERRI